MTGSTKEADRKGRRLGLAALLGALSAAPSLAIDMYIPALPDIAADLTASASQVQFSLTGFLLGLALGQLLAGPLSDAYGRRVPVLVGIASCTVGCVFCALADTAPLLVAARVVTGLAAAAGLVIARAVVTDRYQGVAADRFFAVLLSVAGVVPAIAPLVGGLLLQVVSWRGVFLVIAGVTAAIALCSVRWLPETLPAERRARNGLLAATGTSFACLLRSGRFLRFACAVGLSFAGLFVVISGAPFFLERAYGLSSLQTSLCLAVNGVGIIAAGQLGSRLVARSGPLRLVLSGLVASLAGAGLLIIVFLTGAPFWCSLLGLFLIMSAVGLVLPNATSLAMATRAARDSAGSASALIGVAQFVFGGVAAPLASDGSALPIGVLAAAVSLVALASTVRQAEPSGGCAWPTRAAR